MWVCVYMWGMCVCGGVCMWGMWGVCVYVGGVCGVCVYVEGMCMWGVCVWVWVCTPC